MEIERQNANDLGDQFDGKDKRSVDFSVKENAPI